LSLQNALDAAWASVEAPSPMGDVVPQLIERCERAAPGSADFDSLFVTAAQDACFAVCALLDHTASPEVERIVQTATYATDSIDHYVQEVEKLLPDDPSLESKILAHPLMQQELRRQETILSILEQGGAFDEAVLLRLKQVGKGSGQGNLRLA